MKTALRTVLLGLGSIVLLHCAEGSTFEGPQSDGEGGDGWDSSGNGSSSGNGGGSGGMGTGGNASGGNGGSGGDGLSGSTSAGGGTASTSVSSSSSSAASSSSSSAASSSSSSAASSSSSSAASSSSGGGGTCDPMAPGLVCTTAEHCFPQPNGIPICQGPVGGGGAYSACTTADECQAALNCIDTGDVFLYPCCLRWCKTNADCGTDTCTYLNTPVFVGATQYGVCYDGNGGCL